MRRTEFVGRTSVDHLYLGRAASIFPIAYRSLDETTSTWLSLTGRRDFPIVILQTALGGFMKKSATHLFLCLMAVSGASHAQTSTIDGVRESTSPSRAAEIEQKAEGISGQSSSETGAAGKERRQHKKTKKSKKKSHKKEASGTSGASGSDTSSTYQRSSGSAEGSNQSSGSSTPEHETSGNASSPSSRPSASGSPSGSTSTEGTAAGSAGSSNGGSPSDGSSSGGPSSPQ